MFQDEKFSFIDDSESWIEEDFLKGLKFNLSPVGDAGRNVTQKVSFLSHEDKTQYPSRLSHNQQSAMQANENSVLPEKYLKSDIKHRWNSTHNQEEYGSKCKPKKCRHKR